MAWQKKQNRHIAMGAVRSELRKNGLIPQRQSANTALETLNEIYLKEPLLRASVWYKTCTDNELKLFTTDWDKWCKEQLRQDKEISLQEQRNQKQAP